ncbi:MAG TPA: hypothetical protein VHM88_07460 [Candidatus Acidoferrales bacterium]|nr:hypothetical protein [Candidatus Acidoferrales bacterium]
MGTAAELDRALAELVASGRVEVHENGQWLAALSPVHYEVRRQGDVTLLHLWSEERNLVRRVLRVAEQSPDRIVLEVQRFGRRKPGNLEFVSAGAERTSNRLAREKFRERFCQLLAEQFPDEQLDSLTTAADLEHSLSGCFTRGLLHRGQQAWAVIAASASEDAATVDAILTYGLIWLDRARRQSHGRVVSGLRLFLPEDASRVTLHRLSALAPATRIELYGLNETLWRARQVDPRDIGNLTTWLTPRRELEFALGEAREAVGPIRALAPESIGVGVPPGTRDVALRFRGMEFARWHRGKVFFGLGDQRQPLTAQNREELKELVQKLETFRHPLARDTDHPLYRAQAERWLESLVQADPDRVEARLDARHLYAQVPAFAAGDRGVIDLLGVTRAGRLAVVELKAAEDIHLPLQAVDYWLRVHWHHRQDDFHRYGYFTGVELRQEPPLLYLVAPGFRFHPSTDTVLRYLSPEVEVTRVGLNENWRRGLRVVFRQ